MSSNPTATWIDATAPADSIAHSMPEAKQPKVPITPPEKWVELYSDYLYGFAMSRLRNPEAAADCVQDTFLAGIKALDRFDGSRDIKFWLRGIMRNKIVDQIRKAVKEQKVDIESEDEALMESFWFKYSGIATTNPDPWEFNPRKFYDNSEFWVVFQDCIQQVKDPARQAFVCACSRTRLRKKSVRSWTSRRTIYGSCSTAPVNNSRFCLRLGGPARTSSNRYLVCLPANKSRMHCTVRITRNYRPCESFSLNCISSCASFAANSTHRSWRVRTCVDASRSMRMR